MSTTTTTTTTTNTEMQSASVSFHFTNANPLLSSVASPGFVARRGKTGN